MRIDTTRPFTDEEREYLRAAKGSVGDSMIEANERAFGTLAESEAVALQDQAAADDEAQAKVDEAVRAAGEPSEDDFNDEDMAEVAPLTITQLRARLKKENQDSTGNREELQLRLLEYLDDVRKDIVPEPEVVEGSVSAES